MNKPMHSVLSVMLIPASLLIPAVLLAAESPEGAMGQTELQPLADVEEANRAKQALLGFIRAYELGDVAQIRGMLDNSMIGYQAFIDGVRKDFAAYRQIRIHFIDTRVLAGPDVTVISTKWEKRYLSSADLQPGKQSGESTFLLHNTPGGWKVAALAGDNVVASLGGTLARGGMLGQVTFTPAIFAGLNYSGIIPTSAEVYDLDLSGSGSINVQFVTGQNDSETFTLPEVSPGRFVSTTLNIEGNVAGAPIIQGDGVLRIDTTAGGLPTTVTMRYTDQNPGHFLPQRTITSTMQIQ